MTRPPDAPGGGRPASLTRAAALTYATNFGTAVLSFVNVLIVARVLGPAGRGDVALLITIATLTSHIGTLSVQEANANLAASQPRLRRALGTNSLVLAGLCGVATIVAVAGLVWLFPAVGGDVEPLLLWVALGSIPPLILKRYLNFLVQADYHFGVTNLAWLLGPVTTLVCNGGFAIAGVLSVGTAIGAWVGGQLLGTLLLVWHVRRHAGFARRPDPGLARNAVGFGLKAHGGRFLALGNYRVDQWFVGAVAGSRELGLYSVAVAWAEMLFYLPAVLVMVQRPELVRASPEHAPRFAARVLRVALLLAGAMTVFLVVAAPVLCVTVFGEAFRGSVDDLRVLALAGLGIAVHELLGSALTARRRPLLTTAATAVAFAVTITLNIVLIPSYGGLGAAIATAAAWTAGGVAAAVIFTRVFGARPRELVPRIGEVPWLWRTLRARVRPRASAGPRASDEPAGSSAMSV